MLGPGREVPPDWRVLPGDLPRRAEEWRDPEGDHPAEGGQGHHYLHYGLESLDFDWDKEETTVNHSKQFINENNKRVHTQGIESKWRQVKRQLPSSGR